MAVIAGKRGAVYQGSYKVGELNSFTITTTQNMEETFAFGDDWTTNTATSKAWTFEASGYHDPADTNGQVALINDVLTGDSKVVINVRTEGNAPGDELFTGIVVISEVSIEAAADGIFSFTFSGSGTGALTKTVVS